MQTLLMQLAAFAGHLTLSLVLLAAFVFVYTKSTPFQELALIRKGNTGAAIALAGGLIGFAIVIARSVTVSSGPAEAFFWGAIGLAIQIAGHKLLSYLLPRFYDAIEEGETAPAMTSASVAISLGLVNAACMTP